MNLSRNLMKDLKGFSQNKKDNINAFEYRPAPNVLVVVFIGEGSMAAIYVLTDKEQIDELLKSDTKVEYSEKIAFFKTLLKMPASKEDLDTALAMIAQEISKQKKS